MINSLSLYPFYRATWGYFDPIAIEQLAPLAYDECYVPHYYKAPDDNQEIIGAGGYLLYMLEVTPGSILLAMNHPPAQGNFDTPGFSFKITDMNLGIEIFDSPTPDVFVSNAGPGSFPWLFNSPIPSVDKGLFKVEFWNNSSSALRCNLIIKAAEVRKCQY